MARPHCASSSAIPVQSAAGTTRPGVKRAIARAKTATATIDTTAEAAIAKGRVSTVKCDR